MRHLQFQHHNRDDDGKDSVAKRFEPGCFHFRAAHGLRSLSHRPAVSTSLFVRPWPALKKRIVTSAPALRRCSTKRCVWDVGMIGSWFPAPIQTRTDERSGKLSGTSGTMARNNIAAHSISGRSNNILAAMFAPLE